MLLRYIERFRSLWESQLETESQRLSSTSMRVNSQTGNSRLEALFRVPWIIPNGFHRLCSVRITDGDSPSFEMINFARIGRMLAKNNAVLQRCYSSYACNYCSSNRVPPLTVVNGRPLPTVQPLAAWNAFVLAEWLCEFMSTLEGFRQNRSSRDSPPETGQAREV